ncbi:MAG: Uma2 family endonuclease [Chloroflexota bacterium]
MTVLVREKKMWPPLKIIRTNPDTRLMTYHEYVAWSGEETRAEWIPLAHATSDDDLGKVIPLMPPKRRHQRLIKFLSQLLDFFVETKGLGEVLFAPFEMKLGPGKSSREPDILFVSEANAHLLTEDKLMGGADLIVEIVSQSSTKRDKEDKLEEYREAGVREYWVIDNRPNRKEAKFYQLDAHGNYQQIKIGPDGIYRSAILPGFWLHTDWLWVNRPNAIKAVEEVIGSI